jgi:hypothetical protein
LIETRWAMSYLRGPLTRPEVRRLMQGSREDSAVPASVHAESAQAPEPGSNSAPEPDLTPDRPVVPPDLREVFLSPGLADRGDSGSVWRPALLGLAGLHYARASLGVDVWQDVAVLSPIRATPQTDPWEGAEELLQIPDLERPAPDAARYESLLASAIGAKQRRRWPSQLKAWLYRERPLQLYRIPALKLTSHPGESEAEFRVRVREEARTSRDAAVSKIRDQYRRKVDSLEGKLATARSRLDREKSQYDSQRLESAVSVGSTLLGALLGRRSVTSSRAASAARQVGRASTQRDDVQRAEKSIDELTDRLARIEAELAEKLEQVRDEWDVDALEIEEVSLSPRKSEIGVDLVLWRGWRRQPGKFEEKPGGPGRGRSGDLLRATVVSPLTACSDSVVENERDLHVHPVRLDLAVLHFHGLFVDPGALDVLERLARTGDSDLHGVVKTDF